MPWMKLDVEEQKVRFVVAAARREKPLNALCEEFGISRPTGYLWWRRYEEAGLAGLSKRSRRPKQSPRRTAAELERRVIELRQRYPGQFTDGQMRTLQRHIAVWRAHTILAFDDEWSDRAVDAGQILPQPLRVDVDVADDAAERWA